MKKLLRLVLSILFILFWIVRAWNEVPDREVDIPHSNTCNEYVTDETNLRLIQRSWTGYEYDTYCASYTPPETAMREAEQFRINLEVPWDGDYHRFWSTLYKEVAHHDSDRLTYLQDSLLKVANERELSRVSLAELVVSFVQDIPYEYVLPEPCKGNESHPCNGDVMYGLFSPSEFIWQLKGDCDTRTVLLYSMLQNMGFDAVIFISSQYAHSMLGVDVPASGDYLRHKGVNYYFWETTSKGWVPGALPPEMQQLAYWEVALD